MRRQHHKHCQIKMKKFMGCLTILCLLFIAVPVKINAQFDFTPQVPEETGRITTYNKSDPGKSIVINNKTFLIDQSTIIKTDFKEKSRVRVQYKDGEKEGEKIATKIFEETLFVPVFRAILPIASYIPPTAFSGIGMGDMSGIGKVKSFGWGVQVEMRAYKNIRLVADIGNYSYNQVLAKEGETVHSHLNYGSPLLMPLGARYICTTGVVRLGVKYVFLKDKNYSPWVGAGYGINIWKAEYQDYAEEHIYGDDNGSVMRNYITAGIDLKADRIGIFSFFFEAISPVANYAIDDLYGEPYSSFEGMTYPTPRIGISLTVF